MSRDQQRGQAGRMRVRTVSETACAAAIVALPSICGPVPTSETGDAAELRRSFLVCLRQPPKAAPVPPLSSEYRNIYRLAGHSPCHWPAEIYWAVKQSVQSNMSSHWITRAFLLIEGRRMCASRRVC